MARETITGRQAGRQTDMCLSKSKQSSAAVQEDALDRVKAWQHGLVSDGILEWDRRCLQVVQYTQEYGDAHIGYRDNEDADLVRWARKQRLGHKRQTLQSHRLATDCIIMIQFAIWARISGRHCFRHMPGGNMQN